MRLRLPHFAAERAVGVLRALLFGVERTAAATGVPKGCSSRCASRCRQLGRTASLVVFTGLGLVSAPAQAQVATTTVLTSSLNPAKVAQSLTFTATITGTAPTGTVTFLDGPTTLGTGTVSAGKATLSATFATGGVRSLTAVYGGDAVNATSTSAALSQTVNPGTTTTALASAANPAVVGGEGLVELVAARRLGKIKFVETPPPK